MSAEIAIGKTKYSKETSERFETIKVLGQGGEGVVYLVRNLQDDQKYVLKQFYRPMTGTSLDGLRALAKQDCPLPLGLSRIQLLGQDGIDGLYYPYQKLYPVHPYFLTHSKRVSQAMFGAYCRIQGELMAHCGLALLDTVAEHFLVDRSGHFHFVDYGFSIKPIDHKRSLERGRFGFGFAIMLASLGNRSLQKYLKPEKGYPYDQPCVYCHHGLLDKVAAKQPWIAGLLERVRQETASVFVDPQFYLDLAQTLPDRVRLVSILTLADQAQRIRKVRRRRKPISRRVPSKKKYNKESDQTKPMRILFISAFYPPNVVGGWEQLVQDINDRLRKRGHLTHVLTSTYGVKGKSAPEAGVTRLLHLENDQFRYRPLEFLLLHSRQLEQNLHTVRSTVDDFQPDVIFVHVMYNLSTGIPWVAEQRLPGRVVYYIANDWPYADNTHRMYWQDPAHGGWRRWLKQSLGKFMLRRVDAEEKRFPLQFEHVLCVSQAVKKDLLAHTDIPEENLHVVYNGVEVDQFLPPETAEAQDNGHSELSLLYAGSLVAHKGVHTAVEAMALLDGDPGMADTTLTLVGSGHPDYEARLQRMVAEAGLGERVRFVPRVERKDMPQVLRQYQVLVFPSIWEEPLARMMQEAMASGLVVVGTPTGGTPEILQHEHNGLTFAPGQAQDLAKQLKRLHQEPELRQRLAQNARRTVEERFSFERMVDEIEHYLGSVVYG